MFGQQITFFDIAAVVVLIAGALVGRKKGLSEELIPVGQWLAMVVVSGLFYEPLGQLLSVSTQMTLLSANIVAYLGLMLVTGLLFQWIKSLVGEKLVGSDVFGHSEYYLGTVAGMVRFACIIVAVLALLHARYFSPAELAAQAKIQRDNFGTISFPTLGGLQKTVFHRSFTGRLAERYLAQQLIAPTPPGTRAVPRVSIGKKREKLVNEAMGFGGGGGGGLQRNP